MKKYHAWKMDKNDEVIVGSDKLYTGKSCRKVIRHIAYEHNVEAPWYAKNILRLSDGCVWCVFPL